ncbi:Crp/Fnr family transcriptional regulator [Cyanobacterium sp. Dongsha4]|uniref:Crp/Fnr family transcriptional regulator n=1 Tax=Cyanobacterium sp. DS4 TaxID=2878255 RepID=UPI002E80612B|nr:Crp/Fnr family transcriptional regulator [Cyanobacterium sp. Dongsha4]WVL02126.1 Crp/Fnr family transcriptional regulator [Cyanobacterium sp. Dongsha4]
MNKQNTHYKNKLLDGLPSHEYEKLEPHLEQVKLTSGVILYNPYDVIHYAYFPLSAMISLVKIMEDGSTTEIGLIGNEGMIGLPIILGGNYTTNNIVVQISGESLKLRADILKIEFSKGQTLQKLLLLYTQARLGQIAQTAACNRHHKIEARLARWLLSVYDCVRKDEFDLTQEFISHMLGVRRAGVTNAAHGLQEAGIIRYNRGKIVILDRQKLEQLSCECHQAIQNEFMNLLDSTKQ